jgi:hypothetical protein
MTSIESIVFVAYAFLALGALFEIVRVCLSVKP